VEYTLPEEGSMPKEQKTYTREFKIEIRLISFGHLPVRVPR